MPPSKAKSPVLLPSLPAATAKRSPGRNFTLQVGMLTFPIKLHAGARAERISFRQLHDKCLGTLKQQAMTCPSCNTDVAGDEIVKGYQYAKDQYVVVTAEELEAQRTETSTTIQVSVFTDAASVDPIYLETSHYLAPGDGGARGYALLRDVMRKTGKVAIGRAAFSGGSESAVLIRPYGNGLALHSLFYPEELKAFTFPVDQLTITPAEMKLADQLVSQMTGAFEPTEYADTYAANVKELVAAKLAGKKPRLVERQPTSIVKDDLLAALTASVSATAKPSKRKAA